MVYGAGLSLGSAGQVVKVNSGANALNLEHCHLTMFYLTQLQLLLLSEVVFDGIHFNL